MKRLEAVGNTFYVAPVQKKLACRGSSNSEMICFKLDRYVGETDLSTCHCTIKTKNSEGKSDVAIPDVNADDKKLSIRWLPSSRATMAAGCLLVQVQLEKIFDDSSKNINWQSNIMEFEITDSLDAADEIEDQEPTLFQQWEEKVNTLYADANADVTSMQTLQIQVQSDADTVVQQKQSVEQTALQVAQNAQAAAESAQNAAASVTAAQASAAQAQTSVSDANTAQGLAKGYSDAAKTYSDAASVSEQSAQTSVQDAQAQADAAQEAAAQAQQKVNAFSGYTKEEIDNGFAKALIGESTGQSVTLDDMQPNTSFRSLLVTGQTCETGTGDKSPNNPYTLLGTTALTVSDGGDSGSNAQTITLPQTLYSIPSHTSIPNGKQDTYDIISGNGTKSIGVFISDGTESTWSYTSGAKQDGATALFGLVLHDRLVNNYNYNAYCSHLPILINTDLWSKDVMGVAFYYNSKVLQIRVPKSVAADLATLKSWLAAQAAAGTPFTVAYPLAEPITFTGNPLTIPANPGTVSANCGTISVRYCRDVNAALAKIESSL